MTSVSQVRRGLWRSPSLARIAALGMTFAFSLVVARVLGPHDAGVVYAAVVGASAVGMVARFGTEYAVLRHGSPLHGVQGLSRETLGWDRLLRLCTVGSLVCGGVVVAALQVAPVGGNRGAYTAFALSIPFQSIGVLCSALLRASGQAGRGAFAEVGLAQGIAAAVAIGLGVADRADAATVGLVFTGAWALVCAWALMAVRRSWQVPASPAPAAQRAPLTSLGAMMTSSLLFYLLTWSPIAVLVAVSTQTEVAWYGAAARFPTLIALVPTIYLTAGLPTIASSVARHQLDEANGEIRRLNLRAAVIALTSGAVLVLAGSWIMALFGPGFEGAAAALTALVIGQVGAVLLGPAATLPLVTGFERQAMVALCLTLPLAFLLEGLLAARWGAAGASAGWSVSICAFGAAVAVILRRRAGIVSYLSIGRSSGQRHISGSNNDVQS